jgi:hypothetical protein
MFKINHLIDPDSAGYTAVLEPNTLGSVAEPSTVAVERTNNA